MSGASEAASASPPDRVTEPVAYALSYVLAPSELRSLRRRLAKAGYLDASPPSTPQYPPSTPAPSAPTTPTALVHHVDLNDSLLDDDYLPFTTRKATRTALLAALAQAAFDLLLYIRTHRSLVGSSKALNRRMVKSAVGAGLFVAVYRTLLQLLVAARAKVLLPKVTQWSKLYLPAPAPLEQPPVRSRRSSSIPQTAAAAANTSSSSSRASISTTHAVVEVSHRERVLRRVLGALESRSLVPALAGFLAAPTLALLPQGIREFYALDALVKAVKFLVDDARLTGQGPLSKIPRWVGASLVFALANGQLVWATLFERDTVNRLYGNLILSRSSAYIQPRPQYLPTSIPWPSQQKIVDTIALLSAPKKKVAPYPTYKSPLLSALTTKKASSAIEAINPILDYAPAHPGHTSLLCAVLHPNDPSCRSVFLQFWRKEWPANLKLVGLVLGAITLGRFKTLSHDPETALFRFGMGSVQGATFATGFVGSLWATHCFLQEWLPRTLLPKARYFLNGAIASLFMFALPTAWRGILTSYAARCSLYSTFHTLNKRGTIRPIKHGEMLVLALALSILAPLYEEAPKTLDRTYQRLLRLLIGSRQGGAGRGDLDTSSVAPPDKEARDYFLAKAHLRSLSTIHPHDQQEKDGKAR